MKNMEKFLNKLYDSLVQNKIIIEQTKPSDLKDKINRLKDYLNKRENITNNTKIEKLKQNYYEKYIIKEENIPLQYYKKKISEITSKENTDSIEIKKELAEELINDQKISLDKWIDYFSKDEGANYPLSLKIWAYIGMINLANYEPDSQTFTRRSKNSTNNFADLNIIALTQTLEIMNNYLKEKKIDNPELKKIVENYSFSNIYTYYFSKEIEQQKSSLDGIWIKYAQNTLPNKLVESLNGMGTNWCIAAYYDAKRKLELGSIYIYYTKNINGNYTVPRLAIRYENDKIAEIKGIAKEQNIETNMEEIVANKLLEIPNGTKYLPQTKDMNKLTMISKKIENKLELTREDLIFIYEINGKINGFGNRKDPRIEKIINTRNKKKDLSIIFRCNEKNIACDLRDLINNPNEIICYYGDLNARFLKKFNYNFKNLTCIVGNFIWKEEQKIKGFENIQVVTENIDCPNLRTSSSFNKLEKVGGKVDFSNLEELENIPKLSYIGGNLYIKEEIWNQNLENKIEIKGTKFLISKPIITHKR